MFYQRVLQCLVAFEETAKYDQIILPKTFYAYLAIPY